jgi:hypothetical protein
MMVVLLSLVGFGAIVAGVFLLGLGLPVKDTTFGAAVLVSASVAITGGLILAGLAAAVSELRQVLRAALRQTRTPLREAEHSQERPHVRRMEPRLGAPGADPADVIPTRFDAPGAPEQQPYRPSHEDVNSPPLAPAEASGTAIKPVRVLKSGMVNDVAYTLFSDGSIETQTPGGTLRFGSIDEFRKHLENSTG